MYTPIDSSVYVNFKIVLLHFHLIADHCKKDVYRGNFNCLKVCSK